MGLRKDVFYAKKVCDNRCFYDYSKVYFNSNEDLDYLFSNFDFEGKNVLSVLSSSDQLFKLKELGAKRVDTFDKNKLTYYYSFLRLWTLNYLGEDYPFEVLKNNHEWLNDLLSIVECSSDEEIVAFNFWKKLADSDKDISRLFVVDEERIEDSSFDIGNDLSSIDIKFINMDLFKKSKYDQKYDYVILSNILEWSHGDSTFLEKADDNLNKMVMPGGSVICSRINYKNGGFELDERSLFDSNFEFNDLGEKKGYSYTKNG